MSNSIWFSFCETITENLNRIKLCHLVLNKGRTHMPINTIECKKAAVDKIKQLRAKEREEAQACRVRVNVLEGEVSTDDANARLYEYFKRLDRFKASSMSRGGKKVAR